MIVFVIFVESFDVFQLLLACNLVTSDPTEKLERRYNLIGCSLTTFLIKINCEEFIRNTQAVLRYFLFFPGDK